MITQEDYEWLFRRLPAMSTLIAADGTYLDVNDAMLERLGYGRDEMVGHRPEDFMTPDSARRVRSELRPALRRRGKLEDAYISFVTAGGEVLDCITNALVEYDRSGEFLRTVGMYTEVSDQARANF